MSTKEKEQLVAEVNILKDLKHPNIVEFLERAIDRENSFIYILMEYCEGGDLASVIRRHKEKSFPIPEEFVWNIMTQLTMALHECHCGMSRNEETNQPMPRAAILHRDLKPDNVFLDANKNVKLGDFGLSRSLSNPQKAFAQTYVGTPFYMSPELISESIYDVKSDIWSLGCIIFEMCALEPPFLADTQAQLSAKIKLGRIQTLPAQYSHELSTIIKAMLQLNSSYLLPPRKRPTTTELLANPRIKVCKKHMENERRSEELEERERLLSEWTEKYREKENILVAYDRKLRAEEQRLREIDTILISKEEAIRSKEAMLIEHEKRLAWERQHLEEKRRELLMEQEKRQSERKSLPSKLSSEPMAIDNGYLQESSIGKPITASTISTPAASHPPLASANATLDQYLGSRGAETADQAQASWSVPRRKTGLSVGARHSLQPSNAYRSSAVTGAPAQHPRSTSEVPDLGDTQSNSRLASISSNVQRPSVLGLFSTSNESPSYPSKPAQEQPYFSSNGKESRLSGKLSSFGGFVIPSSSPADLQRLRGKSKSASTLIASMSSTSLSSATSAPPPSNKLFLVPDSSKLAAPIAPSARGTPISSSDTNSTISFNNTQSTLPTPTPSVTSNDSPMPFTSEISSQPLQGATEPNGNSYNRPSSSSNGVPSRTPGFNSHPHPSSLSSSSSAISNYTTRRSLAPSQTRFNFSPSTVSNSTSSVPTTAFTYSANSPPRSNGGGTTLVATSTALTSTNSLTNPEISTTPSKGQGAMPFSDTRYNRPSTPPKIVQQNDEDSRMEWDDDLPSPFIKKTYTRPPSSAPGGSSFARNPMGS
ncbi:G2-specific serine/threonine protein kinase [Haplosporangium sp. Z 27]|nr:G2-specific serine/threonine protein kinase [Haplosporangium sp. Z 27]